MILVIDNYDSFTFNLVQYFGELGADLRVVRNDQITVEQVEILRPQKIVVSPGPCSPTEAGVSCAVIERLGPRIIDTVPLTRQRPLECGSVLARSRAACSRVFSHHTCAKPMK